MKRLIRLLAGVLGLGVGASTAWLAAAFYRAGTYVARLNDGLPAVDYAVVLSFGALAVIFLALAYVFLLRSSRA